MFLFKSTVSHRSISLPSTDSIISNISIDNVDNDRKEDGRKHHLINHLTNNLVRSDMASSSANPIRRKLVIVGDGACGKTSLLCVFSLGEFPKEYEPTIFENYVAEIQLDGKPVQLALWDTAGQEEYERLRPLSYSKAHVILIAFAIDTPDSLENVSVKWIEEVRNICGFHIPVLLVGCKSDLRDNAPEPERSDPNRFVQTADALRTLQALSIRSYHECSSLANIGVDDVFEAATRVSMLVRDDPSGPGAGSGAGAGSGSGSGSAGGTSRRRNEDRKGNGGGCCVIL